MTNRNEYINEWTKNNTKMVPFRINKSDPLFKKLEFIKAKGVKVSDLFRRAIEEEYKRLSK